MNNVPTWVYILFFILLYLGIKRCFTRVISLNRLVLIPAIFIFLSLRSTYKIFQFSSLGFVLLLIGGAIGCLLGYYQIRNCIIKADKENQLIQIPGDVFMLVMVMTVFFIEFFIHYSIDSEWVIADSVLFRSFAVLLSGVVVGISIGRNITYLLKYNKSTSVTLVGS